MKALFSATERFFSEIWDDVMLAAMPFVPLVMGLVFKFGVPALERFLCSASSVPSVLAPYYYIFDMLLCMMTPLMFTFSGVMVVLSEADSGVAKAISATPLGRGGYVFSRIGVPCVLATLYGFIIICVFSLCDTPLWLKALLALCSGAFSAPTAVMVVAFAKNKVVGMALTKTSGITLIGIPAAIMVSGPAQYLAGVFPNFWMTRMMTSENALWSLPALTVSALWCALFYKRFKRRMLA